jgi:hypothetical protein
MDTATHSNGTRAVTLTASPERHSEIPVPISESTARLLGAAAILGIGVIHILDAASTYHSTRWIFWAYVAVIVSAVPVALTLLHWASPIAWGAAVMLAGGPLLGYLLSRSIGLPGDAPDVGNWLCTLGITALFTETLLIALGATRLAIWRRSR